MVPRPAERQHDDCIDLLADETVDLIELTHNISLGVFGLHLNVIVVVN